MKIPKVRSLRLRLCLIHGLVIATVMGCFGLARYQTVSYRSRRNFDGELLRDAEFFARHLQVGAGGIAWPAQDWSVTEALRMDALRTHFILTDPEGKVLSPDQHGPFLQAMVQLTEMGAVLRQSSGFKTVSSPTGAHYRFVSLPVPGAGAASPGTVHLWRTTGAMDEVLSESLRLYFWSTPLILLTSVGVGWLLAGWALVPFMEVARTAGQITSENLNMQIVTGHREPEVMALVQSFNAMVSRLDHSFRQMRRFNADAAHELRTPLAILQGENEIALRAPDLPEEIRAVLASNLEELERLTRLVNDMLTLAEAEAGSQVFTKRPIELGPLLLDLIEQVRLLAAERGIRIEAHDLPDVRIHADELWIRRVFLNLLDNAIKYSRDGGQVDVAGSIRGNAAVVAVRDNGIGIAAGDLPRIFDRLYRADPARSRARGGAGLGLSLVRWVVEAHSGEVRVASRPEEGTTFEVILPLVEGATPQNLPQKSQARGCAP